MGDWIRPWVPERNAMSDREQYNLVERHRLDTWAFVAFFAICGLVAYF